MEFNCRGLEGWNIAFVFLNAPFLALHGQNINAVIDASSLVDSLHAGGGQGDKRETSEANPVTLAVDARPQKAGARAGLFDVQIQSDAIWNASRLSVSST
jgi:hypothetical protein